MQRFVETALKLAPLIRQALPIVVAIIAVISDAFGATSGVATGAAVAFLAAGQAAGDRRRLDAVAAIAAPLKAHDDYVETPVFEFHPDPAAGRHRAVALFLGGRKHDLRNGPHLYLDAVHGGHSADVDYLDEDLDDEDLDALGPIGDPDLDDEPLDDEPTPDRA